MPRPRRPSRSSPPARVHSTPPSFYDKIEAFITKLSMRDNFWNSVCSLIWLPLAFFSGIRMKELDANTFAARAVLPFRRFNRNWYRAMAGGALLANSEIAGGTYVFGICGADYTVVCKNLNYTFLRPCFGPAVYRMHAAREHQGADRDDDGVQHHHRHGDPPAGGPQRRAETSASAECEATFHVTPKVHHKMKKARKSVAMTRSINAVATDHAASSRQRRFDWLGWAIFLGMSWTWCIGMFLPVLLVCANTDMGVGRVRDPQRRGRRRDGVGALTGASDDIARNALVLG